MAETSIDKLKKILKLIKGSMNTYKFCWPSFTIYIRVLVNIITSEYNFPMDSATLFLVPTLTTYKMIAEKMVADVLLMVVLFLLFDTLRLYVLLIKH